MRLKKSLPSLAAFLMIIASAFGKIELAEAQSLQSHNVILFIPDGLRPGSVNPTATPAFARVGDQGVRFANPHSVFPTLTMVNSAAMATGHFTGDTGNFANTVYTGFP